MNKKEILELEEKIGNNARDIKKILNKLETNSLNIQKNSMVLDILRDYKKAISFRNIVILILLVLVILLSAIVVYHHWVVK